MMEMAPNWVRIFGQVNVLKLTKVHCSKLAGLNPNIDDDKVIFGRALGMTKRGVLSVFEEMHDKIMEKNAVGYIVNEPDMPSEKDDCDVADAIWHTPMKDLGFLSKSGRVNIYLRWREGQPLLTFPLITQKRVVYLDLNCFMCHVKQASVYLADYLGGNVGRELGHQNNQRNQGNTHRKSEGPYDVDPVCYGWQR
jgi:hypothetical protein